MASMTGSSITPSGSTSSTLGGNGGLGASSAGSSTDNSVDNSVDRMTQTAHQTVDRLAEKAGPTLDKLRTKMSGANESLKAQADQLKQLQADWTESARTTVREHPIASLAVAMAAGVLLSKIFSSSR